MSSEVLRGERVDDAEPMPWINVGQDDASAPAAPYALAPPRVGRADADARLSAAQAAAERATREARDAGRREGEIAGRQAAHAEVQRAVEELGSAIRQLAELRPRLRLDAEGDLVRLAMAIAQRVVRRELSIDPEAITGLVRTALERLRMQEAIRVRMHPQFQEAVRQFLARTPGAAHIEVMADPTLDRGAIVFDTARGRLDASADTQFGEIERGLTDRLRA